MIKSIVLIGSGNVATHLGLALNKSGYKIIQVYSPNLKHANLLAKKLKAKACSILSDISQEADLYIMAVKDDAIHEISSRLNLINKIIIHTSGSVSLDELKKSSKNIGVFYPLQTFSKKRKIDFSKIPIFIEASNKLTEKTITQLAKKLSANVKIINSEQRKTIHIAAVFACNFSNYLFTISEKILYDHQLSFDILKPLIYETLQKIERNSPKEMQTGPATRKDKKTIQRHLNFLKAYPNYQKLYKIVSENIMKNS